MMERFIGVDLDDTIADYVGRMAERYGPPTNFVQSNLDSMFPWVALDLHFEEIDHNWFLAELKPMPSAANALHLLRKSWPIRYITARHKNALFITHHWLRYHGFPNGRMVFLEKRQAKMAYLAAVGECMIAYIDDLPQFLEAASTEDGRIVIAYARPWNVGLTDFPRAEWPEIPAIIAKAKRETKL